MGTLLPPRVHMTTGHGDYLIRYTLVYTCNCPIAGTKKAKTVKFEYSELENAAVTKYFLYLKFSRSF